VLRVEAATEQAVGLESSDVGLAAFHAGTLRWSNAKCAGLLPLSIAGLPGRRRE
jgi:hypothetical protein